MDEKETISNVTSIVLTMALIKIYTEKKCMEALDAIEAPDGDMPTAPAVLYLIGACDVMNAALSSVKSDPMTAFDEFLSQFQSIDDAARAAAKQDAAEAAS